ncbi:MAG: (2Fe-2S)-binding protein [Acidobacteriia bacterium]|nr:(2Fe-2S)-binding protein [Terriglobia bacterium]
MPEFVTIWINGSAVRVPAGTPVSIAVLMAGHSEFRRSVSGEPRGPLCGMGICMECRVQIDNQAHCRSCQILCQEGMTVRTHD